MPDGQRYLWTARAITRHRGGWGEPGKTFAIGHGCEIRHAHRLVHFGGIDLSSTSAATPNGMGCRVCERLVCPQRAAPSLGRALRIDENASTFVPYPVTDRPTDRPTARPTARHDNAAILIASWGQSSHIRGQGIRCESGTDAQR